MKKPQFLLLFLLISSCFAQYDVIFVGIGTSSSIALSKLVQAFPEKQFLALDMGGPTAAQIGGTNFPSYMPSGTTNRATITDVPGEYSNIAFNPQGEPYRLPFFDFAWQGKAFGGNSQFNGMLYQEPPTDYMESLPTGWKSANLQTYFNELRSTMTINNTPSKDRQTYLGGIHDILADIYKTLGWTSQDTSKLGGLTTPYYSRPYVATDGNGQRGGPVSGYLSKVIGANGQSSKSNLVVIRNAQVNQILFNGNTATGVSYNGVQATLKAGGRVVLGAGALVTPRLLYLSGVGPKGSEGAVMDVGGRTFKINNARVGKNVYDHAGTPITFQYNGTRPVQFMDYTDTNSANNQAAITQYKNSRSGAYAQYGPVSVAHAKSDASKTYPNFELFVNPSTPGKTKTFQMVSMLLRTRGTRQFGLDFQDNVKNPQIWFSDDNDANDQTNAIILTVNQVLSKNTNIKITSGPSSMDFNTVKNYVKSQVFIMNHYSGTVPLVAGDETVGGVNPADVRLRGTTNVHVVDASILPGIIPCHPVAIIMAAGAKSADLIAASIRSGATSAATSTSSSTSSTSASSSSSVPTSTGTTPAAYLYYSFDAVSVTTVTDGSGNGRTGTLQNGPSVVAGKVGNGLKFSQTNTMQQIQVSNGNTLAGSFSASFWMNPEDKNNLAKLLNAKVNWNDANGWTVELDSSTNFINFVASGQYTAKFSVPNLAYGQFSHVAIVVDNQKVSLYINGNLSGSTTFDSTAAVVKAGAPAPLYIGSNNKSAGNGFNGIIDEFRLFSVALTQAQVTQLYNLK